MASFTTAGDQLALNVPVRGTTVDIAISGTYDMTILFQREEGSPGSGAWVTVYTYNTENATEAGIYTTYADNENLRLFLSVDGGGTATVTLTDNEDKIIHAFKDLAGVTLAEFLENECRFYSAGTLIGTLDANGLKLVNGLRRSSGAIVNVTSATVTITAAAHAGRIVTFNKADGITATLPAATGTGDSYEFFVGTTVTSVGDIIQVVGTDIIQGVVSVSTDAAGVAILTASDSDTITMNGSTTGGLIGSHIRLVDVASGVFQVSGGLVSTGSEGTPFSAAVS